MKLLAIVLGGALAVAAYFGLQFSLNHIVEHGIETIGPELTGTSIELGEVDLTLYSGKGSIRGIVVGNPKGFESDSAFKLDEVRVDVDPLSVFGDTIVMQDIYIDSPEITFERKKETTNLGQITRHIQAVTGDSSSGDDSSNDDEPESGSETKIRIERFELRDATVKASILKDRTLDMSLADIELTDLGAPAGATPQEVSVKVMKTLTKQVGAAVTKEALALGMGNDGKDDRSRSRRRKASKD